MKNPLTKTLVLLPAAILLLMIPTAQASLLTGDTLTCGTSPSFVFSCSASTAVDGSGLEFTLSDGGNNLQADFGATDLTITNPGAITGGFSDTFGPGIFLNFTDSTNPFTGATFVSTANTGFGAGNLSFSGGIVTLSVSSIVFKGGGTIDISLATAGTTATAPEPATAGLMGGTLLLGMLWMRSRKRA